MEYALTSFGHSLCDALAPLSEWGQKHMKRIEACQKEQEAERLTESGGHNHRFGSVMPPDDVRWPAPGQPV